MKYKIGAKRRRIIMPNKIDLHMHSTASDGTDTPLQLAEIVQSAGITILPSPTTILWLGQSN